MGAITAPQQPPVAVGDVEFGAVSFASQLDSGETLTGMPTVTEQTTSDLTLGSKAVNTGILTIDGRTVAIGNAVQFSVSGQLASHSPYTLKITVSTSAGRTKNRYVRFLVSTT
jgi:hypothetical protein